VTSTKAIKPRKTAVQERSKFTVETIFEAAVQVFTENGYAGATTDLIAERAGVSVGTLYQYFPNKQAILIEIWNRCMEDADRARESFAGRFRCEGELGADTIKAIFKAVYQLHQQSIKPHLFFEEVPQPDFIKKRLLEKENTAVAIFTALLEHASPLRKSNAHAAARMMYEVMERLIHRYLVNFKDELTEDEFIEEATDMICRYLFADEK
jgi:AcrR family transcriptional regulator